MRIVFFGTPLFAIPALKALLDSGEEVIAVVTQPDRRKGRDRIATPSAVKNTALEKGIAILQPLHMKDPAFLEELSRMDIELIVVVAYGKILPAPVLALPQYGCINVHASLLPKYRGAAPIQWALIHGEKKTGITTMLMDEGLDSGNILLKAETEIGEDENAGSLGQRLSELGASLLIETIRKLKEGSLSPSPQEGTASYAPTFRKEDGKIKWSLSAKDIVHFVRGMYPWPGAYCYLNKERITITKAKALEGSGMAGRIEKTDEQLVVGTGDGFISIHELKPEGKKLMSSRDFLQGRRLKEGMFFDEP